MSNLNTRTDTPRDKKKYYSAARMFIEDINEMLTYEWFTQELQSNLIEPLLGKCEMFSTTYTNKGLNISNIQNYEQELTGGAYKPRKERTIVFNMLFFIENTGGWIETTDIGYQNAVLRYAKNVLGIESIHRYPYLRDKRIGRKMLIPRLLGSDEYIYFI